jgi:drug/metabolite transporter (DMT)-like permease
MKNKQGRAVLFAVLAAVLYALSTPISKILLQKIPPALMAALLYLGAGIGTFIVRQFRKKTTMELPLTKAELPWTVAMIVLDIIAPIFLMIGLARTTAANTSLLNNFEIVATSMIAWIFFREKISLRLWLAIMLVTCASILLSLEDTSSLSFSTGSIFVLLACVCWGLENNCTRRLSSKDPLEIVVIKGFGSGTGSLVVALILGQTSKDLAYIAFTLVLGFVAYGLSIYFYILAQRYIGAAMTSTFYALSPFVAAALSFIVLKEHAPIRYFIALIIMAAGAMMAAFFHDGQNEGNE